MDLQQPKFMDMEIHFKSDWQVSVTTYTLQTTQNEVQYSYM